MNTIKFILIILYTSVLTAQNTLKHDVYFETDKFNIPETEKSRLLLFLNTLDSVDIKKIAIYGFTDDRGSNAYNLKLSQQRANAIKQVFHTKAFNDSLVTNVDGKGEVLLNIVKEKDINKIRGLNRKVEIIVTKKTKQLPLQKPTKKDTFVSKTPPTTEDLLQGNLKAGDKIILENILFHSGYTYLTKESKPVLNKIAEILVKRENIYFTIEGHVCCTPGTRDALDKKTRKRNLSLARARYVYNYLLKKGVARRRMKYIGQRHKFPLGGPPEKDRRVEILVTRVLN